MRELTPEECEFIAGGRLSANNHSFEDEVDEIVVVGSPPPYWPPPYWPPPYYPPPYYPPPTGGGGGGPSTPPPPPPPPCPDTSTMTPEQRDDYEIDSMAADIRDKMLAMSDQRMEYGAVIYRDAAGQLQHTPLIPSADYRTNIDYASLPRNADGTADYSTIVGMIHSHPQYLPDGQGGYTDYYNPADPTYLQRPSNAHDRGTGMQGDWISWDGLVANIQYDGGSVANLRQYIVGFGANGMGLNEYDAADYETQQADGQLDPDIGQCGS